MMLYEALEKYMNRDHSEELLKDLAEARKKKKKRHDSPKTPPGSPPHQPPPPPPPTGPSGAQLSASILPFLLLCDCDITIPSIGIKSHGLVCLYLCLA
uniref:Uncharacterized protein n=1 Tax=Tanacetum cinerariifolium TaxID=118510 RepID=A0A699IMQ4_TANCI|nr:hypothetical protein [Tanacetum cinerariifolium]